MNDSDYMMEHFMNLMIGFLIFIICYSIIKFM